MMAQNTHIAVPAEAWTLLTDANVTSLTFQNVGAGAVSIKGTTNTTEPTDLAGAALYVQGQGERNVALSDLFPGIAAVRVWAYSGAGSTVLVSHA
jgi:hypothetical protein